jgi:hypothetical protein
VVADEEWLPFAGGSFDLVLSNLSLHWVNDLPGALVQIRAALAPDGLLLASLLGGRTLGELRECLIAAEAELAGGASPRVSPFADVRDAGALLAARRVRAAGGRRRPADRDLARRAGADARPARDGRIQRGRRARAARSPGARCCCARPSSMPSASPTARAACGASFEIVTMTAWAPSLDPAQTASPAGSARRARLADALGAAERSAGEKAGPKR